MDKRKYRQQHACPPDESRRSARVAPDTKRHKSAKGDEFHGKRDRFGHHFGSNVLILLYRLVLTTLTSPYLVFP